MKIKKAILLSLHDIWWEKMLSGEKALEIRKTAPKKIKFPFTVYVYLTHPYSAVVGEFTCNAIVKTNAYKYLSERSCVPMEDLMLYGGGKTLCGLSISDVKSYMPDTGFQRSKAKSLSDFGISRPPQSWCYVYVEDAP